MADILLLQPPADLWESVKITPTAPISLLSACRLLAPDFSFELLDARLVPDWRAAVRRSLLNRPPLCVGLPSGVFGPSLVKALQAAAHVRSVCDVPILFGGIPATLAADDLLSTGLVDLAIRGEGEEILPRLLGRLRAGQGPDGLRGVSHLRDDRAVHEPDAPAPQRLAELPDVPWHAVPFERYLQPYGGRPTLPLETSRGCPHACPYCRHSIRRSWCKYRIEPADSVLARIERLVDLVPGLKNLELLDETFPTGRRFRELCQGMIAMNRDLTYRIAGATVHDINALSDAELDLARRSGCIEVCIAAESGRNDRLGAMGKRHSVADMYEINRRLGRFDIKPNITFLLGLPGETEADAAAAIELAFGLLEDNPAAVISDVSSLVPFPGTVLWDTCLELGYRPPEDLYGWAKMTANHSQGRSAAEFAERRPWHPSSYWEELDHLSFLTLFFDDKISSVVGLPLASELASLYRPLARWRARNRRYELFLEKWLFDLLARPELPLAIRRAGDRLGRLLG